MPGALPKWYAEHTLQVFTGGPPPAAGQSADPSSAVAKLQRAESLTSNIKKAIIDERAFVDYLN